METKTVGWMVGMMVGTSEKKKELKTGRMKVEQKDSKWVGKMGLMMG